MKEVKGRVVLEGIVFGVEGIVLKWETVCYF